MGELNYISDKAIVLVIVLCAAPVVVATVVGLVVGLFQAVTQIQEQTLPFGIKLLAVFGVLLLLSNWIGEKLMAFAIEAIKIGLK